EAEAQARMAEAEARLVESDARRAESAEVGIFHSFPAPVVFGAGVVGFNPTIRPGFHRGGRFQPGCNRSRGFVIWPPGPALVNVPGRGGAFMATNDRTNPTIRH
ncbi:MAG TPA: hypothetical protein VF310_10610, partial [Vicinamibacteria bacterium]